MTVSRVSIALVCLDDIEHASRVQPFPTVMAARSR
jgi:hypothetical protein